MEKTNNEILAACLTEKRNLLRENWYDFTAAEIQDKLTKKFEGKGFDAHIAKYCALKVMMSIAESY